MKYVLRSTGLVGLLLFASAFAATFVSPIHYERAAKTFIQSQVEGRVRDGFGELRQPGLAQAAGVLSVRYRDDIARLQQQLQTQLPERVAAVVAKMLDADCECRERLAVGIRHAARTRIDWLKNAQPQLTALIQGKYVEVVEALLRDLRIFTGSNALVFVLLVVASCLRPQAITQLWLPLSLLLAATLASTYVYLFRQNWFFTIIHNDYVGYGYSVYLLLVFLLLCDVVFNHARVTTEALNQLLRLLGHAGTLTPC